METSKPMLRRVQPVRPALTKVFSHEAFEFDDVFDALNGIAKLGKIGKRLREVTCNPGKSLHGQVVTVKIKFTFNELQ